MLGDTEPERDCVHCLLVASRVGSNVLFERFYKLRGETTTDSERTTWRRAFHAASSPTLGSAVEEEPYVANHRSHTIVWTTLGGLVLFIAGSGIYDELSLAEILRSVVGLLKTTTKSKAPTEMLFQANLGKFCLTADELLYAGHVEMLDKDAISRHVKLKTAKEKA
ncbi:hypothetical protein CYMTET_3818 [Cymbomonas tetramitiformis]|uniref:Coatomer subunit zeta n=1 Tax=Cymbomonas tetramitiformis TaxID=36881 RepID=A0AAE0H4A6_9CHLO|nr:hypothetical protein CYMTET_3818 [Cymbomonas tetramitiformis]